jgi:hypothetical protein
MRLRACRQHSVDNLRRTRQRSRRLLRAPRAPPVRRTPSCSRQAQSIGGHRPTSGWHSCCSAHASLQPPRRPRARQPLRQRALCLRPSAALRPTGLPARQRCMRGARAAPGSPRQRRRHTALRPAT